MSHKMELIVSPVSIFKQPCIDPMIKGFVQSISQISSDDSIQKNVIGPFGQYPYEIITVSDPDFLRINPFDNPFKE